MKRTIYLAYMRPGEIFRYKGKDYEVQGHEENMTELCDRSGRLSAWWIWTKLN